MRLQDRAWNDGDAWANLNSGAGCGDDLNIGAWNASVERLGGSVDDDDIAGCWNLDESRGADGDSFAREVVGVGDGDVNAVLCISILQDVKNATRQKVTL